MILVIILTQNKLCEKNQEKRIPVIIFELGVDSDITSGVKSTNNNEDSLKLDDESARKLKRGETIN